MDTPRLTRDQLRELDRRAIEELGIPGIVLMENAARAVAAEALHLVEFFALDAPRPRSSAAAGTTAATGTRPRATCTTAGAPSPSSPPPTTCPATRR